MNLNDCFNALMELHESKNIDISKFSNESLCLGTKVALSCYFNNNSFFNNWKFCDLTIDNIKIEIEKLMQNLTIAEKIQLVLKVNVLPTYKETLVQKFKAAEILQLGENGILISIVDFVGRITNKQTKKAPLTFKKMNGYYLLKC
uniref:Uncharacterized protein n=1 Tax=Strongyloides stercoralis TaxID=6248 RepID=A0A0K0DZW3_STRER